jgi:hypothetical protein
MLDFNLYYAEKVAEARQEEVERRSRLRRRHGLETAVEAVADRTGPSPAGCPEAAEGPQPRALGRRRPHAVTQAVRTAAPMGHPRSRRSPQPGAPRVPSSP